MRTKFLGFAVLQILSRDHFNRSTKLPFYFRAQGQKKRPSAGRERNRSDPAELAWTPCGQSNRPTGLAVSPSAYYQLSGYLCI